MTGKSPHCSEREGNRVRARAVKNASRLDRKKKKRARKGKSGVFDWISARNGQA